MTNLLSVEQQQKNNILFADLNYKNDMQTFPSSQARKSIKSNGSENSQNSQIQQKQCTSKPRSTSYNQKGNIQNKQQLLSNFEKDESKISIESSQFIVKSQYSKQQCRRQTLMMTGQEFKSKKLQITDLDHQQKIEILKRLCNLKAVKTDKDNQLIYDILKENSYIKFIKDTKGEYFVLSKVCPNIKIVQKRQGEIIYEQDSQSKGFYVVIQGECEGRMKNGYTGEARLITDKYIEGTEFGNIELLDQKTRIQTVISKAETWLMHFDTNVQKQFFQTIQKTQLDYLVDMLLLFPCFQNYGKRNLLSFLPFFTFSTYNRNQKVYQTAQPCDYIYFIISGDFKVYQKINMNNDITLDQLLKLPSRLITDEKDKYSRSIEVSLVGSGQIFGEEEIIMKEESRKQDVVCSSPLGQVLLLHKEDYIFKFANDQYFSEIFKSLVIQKRQFRDKRLKEIESISKTTINTQEQNYNTNVIAKKIKLKLEDRVLDLQKKGVIKSKFVQQIHKNQKPLQEQSQQDQIGNASSRLSSPAQTCRRQNTGSPIQQRTANKKARNQVKSSMNTEREKKSEQLINSSYLNFEKGNNIKNDIKTNTIKSFNESQQIYNLQNSKALQSNGLVGREVIPAILIDRNYTDNHINIFYESQLLTNQQQKSPKQQYHQDLAKLKSISSLGQLSDQSQKISIHSEKELSSTLNFKRIKQKNTLDKGEFYGVEYSGDISVKCETSPSERRSKQNKQIISKEISSLDSPYKNKDVSQDRLVNLYKQKRSKSNQQESSIHFDPQFINKLDDVDDELSKTLQTVFYNNQLNLLQAQQNKQENAHLQKYYRDYQDMENSQINQISSQVDEDAAQLRQNYKNFQKPKAKLTSIRSPQDEPQKIYDPTGINKYLRRIFYGKQRKKNYTEPNGSYNEINDKSYNNTYRSFITDKENSTERSEMRNASLEEKFVRQFKKNKNETLQNSSFQKIMKSVDKKQLKMYLHKKNITRDFSEKDKYNKFIKPQGVKKDYYCFEYVNARLSSQYNLDDENYQKYSQMVQQEYQKFKLQSSETFNQQSARADSPYDLDFHTAYNNDFQKLKNKQNANEAEANLTQSQLHNVRASSYSKKRKILKIVNDPNTKKIIILNVNKANESQITQKCESQAKQVDTLEQKVRNLQQNIKQKKKQKELLQLNELLTTKDVINNYFIPSSNEPRYKKQKHQKFINTKRNSSDSKKLTQLFEYVGDLNRYSPSPFRLATIDQ
ncbi:hypothetical protein ABPG72_016059 [Tetrahymena utriculariae]